MLLSHQARRFKSFMRLLRMLSPGFRVMFLPSSWSSLSRIHLGPFEASSMLLLPVIAPIIPRLSAISCSRRNIFILPSSLFQKSLCIFHKKMNSENGRFGVISAKFRIFAIVFSIIDSSNFCFPTAIGCYFIPHITDTKFLTH